jgi:hypothetical protein
VKRFHSSSFISAKKRRRRRKENSYEDLETGRVSSQFEESQDADDGEELENIRIIHMVSQLLESVLFRE